MKMIAYQIHADPVAAKQQILSALHSCEGNRFAAARSLGVSERTLYRWIQELKMYPEIDAAYREWGFDIFKGGERKHI